MYHRSLNIFIASQDSPLETILKNVSPLEGFSHHFSCFPDREIDDAELKKCGVIIFDFETVSPKSIETIHVAKDDQAIVIGCLTPESFPVLADHYPLFDQVWAKPLNADKVPISFAKILKRIKEHEDFLLVENYLETLIDSLPDLIWFKDARGAHLKVNNSFCQVVSKTKAQIEGRGHFYIWTWNQTNTPRANTSAWSQKKSS